VSLFLVPLRFTKGGPPYKPFSGLLNPRDLLPQLLAPPLREPKFVLVTFLRLAAGRYNVSPGYRDLAPGFTYPLLLTQIFTSLRPTSIAGCRSTIIKNWLDPFSFSLLCPSLPPAHHPPLSHPDNFLFLCHSLLPVTGLFGRLTDCPLARCHLTFCGFFTDPLGSLQISCQKVQKSHR